MPRARYLAACCALLLPVWLAACSPAPATPTATPPTPATEAAAAPTPAPVASFDGLPQSATRDGFPQAGFPNAPVSVVLYTAFDDPASALMWSNLAYRLAERAQAGEILITSLPQYSESLPNARGAARAAVCAGQQSAYYAYANALFTAVLLDGSAAFEGARLIDLANQIGLDRGQWDTCMVSETPDRILDEAKRAAGQTTLYAGTPLLLVDSVSSLLDAESLDFTIDRALAAFNAELAEALTPAATAETTPEAAITIEPLLDDALQPPITLELPSGWRAGYATLLLEDLDGPRGVPVAVYSGPVTGGEGTIVLLWGFPNIVSPSNPSGEPLQTDLYLDGLRLLRMAVVEADCNIGTDLRRDDAVGGLAAVGSTFAAVDCPELPDTRGWFAGLRQNGLNYLFYTYADPIAAMDGPAEAELRAILDSVHFLPLPAATATPAGS